MPEGFAMSAIWTSITEAITQVLNWVTTWLGAIVGNPVLLFFCIALPLLTIGLTVVKRLLSVRA